MPQVAWTRQSNIASGAVPSLLSPYRATHPGYVNNPSAVLFMQDFQGLSSQADVAGKGFSVLNYGDAYDLDTPNTSPTEKRAQLKTSGMGAFGQAIRQWHTDGSDLESQATRWASPGTFTPTDAMLYIWVVRYSSTFDGRNDDPGQDDSQKTFWTPSMRVAEINGGRILNSLEWINGTLGGTETLLPGAEALAGVMYGTGGWTPDLLSDGAGSDIGNEEWFRFIVIEEVLSSTSFRIRKYLQILTSGGGSTLVTPYFPTKDGTGEESRTGYVYTGTSIDPGANQGTGMNNGVNKNAPFATGTSDYWDYGFAAAIDLNVYDPFPEFYTAGDMLT